ncbi:phage holin family protein [Corynebacterium aquilae]|uniref:Membrane protein n=1 Tax=Corynebacterium aquilae DSM 44791 TaxID=1431546 RepID=A0A1L7CDH6_9CORY|nr:phage holin family protein [Corynebacterium aquilae]APT83874.1 membrane protein [Corynebacterium aquilae DSM 44791]
MSNPQGLFTDGSGAFSPKVNEIPLADVDTRASGRGSVGDLVSDATAQMSALFRAEVELAKTEIAAEAKKGALGGGLFGAAGVIALYSSFFFFFMLAELLNVWIDQRWVCYLIVFVLMLLVAGLLALIGFKKVKTISAPKNTIDSVGELKKLVPGKAQASLDNNHGLYT